MKNIKTILTVISIFLLYTLANAQGNCPGGKIRVYKGATGCGCHCQKECVTPAQLPDYLANGWNTTGCWNCCFGKNWVNGGTKPTDFAEVHRSLTDSFTPASEDDGKITVTDMAGRQVNIPRYLETEDHELIWDKAGLNSGMYILKVQGGGYSENKIVTIAN